jgi:glutathione-specific gamma-glutamylcyclotransferase
MALSRSDLEADQLRRHYEQFYPELPITPRHEFDASLEHALHALGAGQDLWLFAYGSLIWNPLFHYAERRPALVHGLHRRFCLWSRMGRGSPEQPGLMLALEHGGRCHGFVFRIPAAQVRTELTLIWRREMTIGSYYARWIRARAGGETVRALSFVINRRARHYAGKLPTDEVVRILASASGRLGSAADYLFQTVDCLRSHGVNDSPLFELAQRVSALHARAEAADGCPEVGA